MIKYIILFLFTLSATAEVYIKVTGANVRKAKLAVAKTRIKTQNDFSQKIYNQILSDLEFMGLFEFVPSDLVQAIDEKEEFESIKYSEWATAEASFVLKTSYSGEKDKHFLEALFYDIIGSKKIFANRYSYSSSSYKKLVHALSEDVLKAISGEKGLFFTRVLMTCRERGNVKEIYLTDIDGENTIRLTSDKSTSLSPTWFRDGKKILYTQYQYVGVGKKRTKVAALKMHDLTSGKRTLVSAKNGLNSGASVSPDNKFIALTLTFSGKPEIYLLDAEKFNEPRAFSRNMHLSSPGGTNLETSHTIFDVEPSWSPDGNKLVISSARTGHPMIYIVDIKSLEAKQLTFAGTYNSSPDWSPIGDKIVFAAQMSDTGHFDLFVIDIDGNNLARLTQGGKSGTFRVNYEDPSFAPTGRHITYSSNENGHYEVYISTLDWTVRKRISPAGKECTNPSWEPLSK